MRKYLNNYETTLSAAITSGDTTISITTAPPALSAGDYYVMTLTDDINNPTKIEIVKITAVSGTTLTAERGYESTTAKSFDSGDIISLRATADSFETLAGPTITRYAETIAAATTTIDRADGGIQTLTLTADSALTWTLNDGEKIQLYLTPAGFNVTSWGVTYWMTDVPTLATENMIVVEKVGGNIYAWDGGSR